jgi:hypothetical protein
MSRGVCPEDKEELQAMEAAFGWKRYTRGNQRIEMKEVATT